MVDGSLVRLETSSSMNSLDILNCFEDACKKREEDFQCILQRACACALGSGDDRADDDDGLQMRN